VEYLYYSLTSANRSFVPAIKKHGDKCWSKRREKYGAVLTEYAVTTTARYVMIHAVPFVQGVLQTLQAIFTSTNQGQHGVHAILVD
jgi:hypothetical protein